MKNGPTPRPWRIEAVSNAVRIVTGQGRKKIILARLCPPQLPEQETWANAHLMVSALDHAIYAAAITAGVIRWEPFATHIHGPKGEIVCNGMRYTTELDAFGVPVMSDLIARVIAAAMTALEKGPTHGS